ncbi:MAG: hypothetical protein AAB355_03475 [Patescibacteria group bacterium]
MDLKVVVSLAIILAFVLPIGFYLLIIISRDTKKVEYQCYPDEMGVVKETSPTLLKERAKSWTRLSWWRFS